MLKPTLLLLAAGCVFAQTGVYMNRYDLAATGANLHETTLTPDSVKSGKFGKLYSYYVDGAVFAQPLYVPAVAIPGHGAQDLLFVATTNDRVYAFNADHAG